MIIAVWTVRMIKYWKLITGDCQSIIQSRLIIHRTIVGILWTTIMKRFTYDVLLLHKCNLLRPKIVNQILFTLDFLMLNIGQIRILYIRLAYILQYLYNKYFPKNWFIQSGHLIYGCQTAPREGSYRPRGIPFFYRFQNVSWI